MSVDKTKIEWADSTWSPVTGCDKVSPGCDHCYAETIATRFAGTKAFPQGFKVTLRPASLEQPLRWRRPRRIFVNSMSDLFHEDIPDQYIARVFAVMALAGHHTFQILTKRHARLRSLLNRPVFYAGVYAELDNVYRDATVKIPVEDRERAERWSWGGTRRPGTLPAPLPNVWLGVSTEDQKWADIRIPALLGTPAAVRFISAEPLLGPIDLADAVSRWVPPNDHPLWSKELVENKHGIVEAQSRLHTRDVLHWVIAGGESGRDARPMDPQWARQLRDACQKAGIAFHFKQYGEWAPKGTYAVGILDNGEIYGSASQQWPHGFTGHEVLKRIGKKKAGRTLDGRTWDEYPAEVG